jgi:hypothetical protein
MADISFFSFIATGVTCTYAHTCAHLLSELKTQLSKLSKLSQLSQLRPQFACTMPALLARDRQAAQATQVFAHGAQQRHQAGAATLLVRCVSVNCQVNAVQLGEPADRCRAGVREKHSACKADGEMLLVPAGLFMSGHKRDPATLCCRGQGLSEQFNPAAARVDGYHVGCKQRGTGMIAILACTVARVLLPVWRKGGTHEKLSSSTLTTSQH